MQSHRPLLLALITCMSVTSFAQTQDPHVRSEYLPDVKRTRVETDMLFVINTAEQFVQVGFLAFYAKQQLVTGPKNITVTIFSNSPKPIYENTKDQNLVVITDGDIWKVGELTYWSGKGAKADKGQEMFASEKRPGLGMQNPLPASAKVSEGRDIDHLYMEWLFIDLTPEQFAKLSKSTKVEFQIGKTKFQFNENQVSTIRAFGSLITP